MHPWLAFVCFFRLLFGRKLPAEVVEFLPDDAKPKALPEPKPEPKKPEPEKPKVATAQVQRDGALALLALMQREGRLVDFLRDDVGDASDADIGAVAREVHRGCKKVLDQHMTFEPVMPGEQDAKVSVPKGFDPTEIRLIGEAKGDAPYRGALRHHGWRAVKTQLPALADGVDRAIVAPAEVEV